MPTAMVCKQLDRIADAYRVDPTQPYWLCNCSGTHRTAAGTMEAADVVAGRPPSDLQYEPFKFVGGTLIVGVDNNTQTGALYAMSKANGAATALTGTATSPAASSTASTLWVG